MKWCEVVGAEPYLCLNMGTGTLSDGQFYIDLLLSQTGDTVNGTTNTSRVALAWLEYCNSDRDTYYANLRRQNGREKPYNVCDLITSSCPEGVTDSAGYR